MLNLQRGLKNDRLLRALTGLNRKAFEELKSALEQELSEEQVPRRSQEERKRVPGAGRKPRLETVEKKLIDILFYFKCYPTFDLAGILFDLDRSQANRWMHRLQPILDKDTGEKNGTTEAQSHEHE